MSRVTLHLTDDEARLVQLGLSMLVADRKRAPFYAEYLVPEARATFLRKMGADHDGAKAVNARLDAALVIRRQLTDSRAAAPENTLDVHLPDAPANDVEATDCTGVITGNADLVSERGEYTEREAPAPLPIYPQPGVGSR